jgi:hypothetical protein
MIKWGVALDSQALACNDGLQPGKYSDGESRMYPALTVHDIPPIDITGTEYIPLNQELVTLVNEYNDLLARIQAGSSPWPQNRVALNGILDHLAEEANQDLRDMLKHETKHPGGAYELEQLLVGIASTKAKIAQV